MDRENIEEGQITRSLLVAEKPDSDATGCDGGEEAMVGSSSFSSTVTVVVVLSTFVAVNGSFAYGFAVSSSAPPPLIHTNMTTKLIYH